MGRPSFCFPSRHSTALGQLSTVSSVYVGKMLPTYTNFDIQNSEVIRRFLRMCNVPQSRDRRESAIHITSPLRDRFEWRRNPACRSLAEHPTLLEAARKTMGLHPEAPLWLFGVEPKKRKKGDVHRLHSDMEFSGAESRPFGGATLWILLKSECSGASPLSLVAGSHLLTQTANDELVRRKCWTVSSEPLACNVTEIIQEMERKFDYIQGVEGPSVPFTGIAWPSSAWHMTQDTCSREAVIIKYVASVQSARSLVHKNCVKYMGECDRLHERTPFHLIGRKTDEEDEDPLDYLHRFPPSNRSTERSCDYPKAPKIKQGKNTEKIHRSGPYKVQSGAASQAGFSKSQEMSGSILIDFLSNRLLLFTNHPSQEMLLVVLAWNKVWLFALLFVAFSTMHLVPCVTTGSMLCQWRSTTLG